LSKKVFIIYPNQLFEDISKLYGHKVLLVEESLFFIQYSFHIQKLVFHRASMKFYENYLKQNNLEVEYFEDESYLEIYKNKSITIYDVADDWLLKKITKNFKNLTILYNPNFLNVNDNNKFLHKYYINRRKELNILVCDDKPEGGKWSFDEQNRLKFPKDEQVLKPLIFDNEYICEAKKYVQKFNTVGSVKEFYHPITFYEVRKNFDYFLKNKFEKYGDYQDAIVEGESFLYHSNISSALNAGLLSLKDVIQKIYDADVSLNSKEGFIRQIIGWREFMFSIYKSSHITLRNSNFFDFKNKIPAKLLNGNSGLKPLDDAVQKLDKTAYNHHIERLMIFGNIFLLLEIKPDEVYEFFMANYIDAYDWVMVGNVYGMSGYSDGGSITTKPYISSSNYIVKMSNDYKKSDEWCKVWDGLYWRFLDRYKHFFKNNYRMKMQLSLLNKMPTEKLQNHIQNAEIFIKSIN
jgi:deoxyribodipyrimidine photolyase-related protein